METETTVVIVGAGPSGLAVSACLNRASVPNIVLERDHCVAPLWRHRTYDRLHLHLPKQLCQLPHAPYPAGTPTYVPRAGILRYLDNYADRFGVRPLLHREVVSAQRDETSGLWRLCVKKTDAGEEEYYLCKFLVVASGENDEPVLPVIPGLETFPGVTIHSSAYRSAKGYEGKDVLVVGSGNSGMEIAYDLADGGARTSIVIRSPHPVLAGRVDYDNECGAVSAGSVGSPNIMPKRYHCVARMWCHWTYNPLNLQHPQVRRLVWREIMSVFRNGTTGDACTCRNIRAHSGQWRSHVEV